MTPLCVGKWALFDSTDPGDHDQAAKLCAACPVRACDGLLTQGAEGTWGGRLYGGRTINGRRLDTEDAMFTDADARAAHTAWNKGEKDDRTRIGERVYQRRASRQQRARRDAA